MGFVKNIGVCKERAKAGFGAEVNRPPAVFGAWEIGGICVAEDTSAQSDELAGVMFDFCCHVSYSIFERRFDYAPSKRCFLPERSEEWLAR